MMMRWIAFAGGAAVLGGGAWYFGQPEAPPVVAPPVPVVAPVPVEAAEAPKDLPPMKVVQVIDLARAYEPVPEPEPSAGTNAALLELSPVPDRMPYADGQVKPASFWFGDEAAAPEHLKVEPREVDPFNLLHFDDPNLRVSQLLNESSDLREAREEMAKFWMNNKPSVLEYERLNGPLDGTERLDVMPRVLHGGLLNFVPTPAEGGLLFIPNNPPLFVERPREVK